MRHRLARITGGVAGSCGIIIVTGEVIATHHFRGRVKLDTIRNHHRSSDSMGVSVIRSQTTASKVGMDIVNTGINNPNFDIGAGYSITAPGHWSADKPVAISILPLQGIQAMKLLNAR